MKFEIHISKKELIEMVLEKIREKVNGEFKPENVKIETKSAQNYRSEWETAEFRATYQGEA